MQKTLTLLPKPLPPPPKLLRVAGYARVSSSKDAMLHSLSAQVSYYSRYIQTQPGWSYVGTYADEAYTGTKESRPEFQRLLSDCRAGKIDRVITKSISRFARNTVTLLETTRELKALNIGVTFEEQNIDSLSGDGELMLTILASFAQAESLSVSDNCKWRIRNDFLKGKVINMYLLYGYRVVKGAATIVSEQATVVRSIFTDYVSGIGTAAIARRLTAEHIPPMRGGQWTDKRVRELLKNEKYTGNSVLQKTFSNDHLTKRKRINRGDLPQHYAENTHPAIIDQATFECAQSIMSKNWQRTNVRKPTVAQYPFSGMITCAHCGKHYKRKTTSGRVSWQCATFISKGKAHCPAKQIPEDTLYMLAAEALGITLFDETLFKSKIVALRIPAPNRVIFLFRDGHETEHIWHDRSRSESWNDAMRKSASEKSRRQFHE